MSEKIETVYVYATARDDGLGFAIGATYYAGNRANGSYALFSERNDALEFAAILSERNGATLLVLPTVAGGENMIEKADGSFHPLTVKEQ